MQSAQRALFLLFAVLFPTFGSSSKPRFGMFFQMQRKGASVTTGEVLEHEKHPENVEKKAVDQICFDQNALQQQLELVRDALKQTENDALLEKTQLTQQLAQMHKQLDEARQNNKPDVTSNDNFREIINKELDEQRFELDNKWMAKYEGLNTRFHRALNERDEAARIAAELDTQLKEITQKLHDINVKWKQEKQGFTEEVEDRNKELASVKDSVQLLEHRLLNSDKVRLLSIYTGTSLVRNIHVCLTHPVAFFQDAEYWKTTFNHRAYLNITHVAHFVGTVMTAVSGPVLDSFRSVYQARLKSYVDTVLDIVKPVCETQILPFYDEYVSSHVIASKEKACTILEDAQKTFDNTRNRSWHALVGAFRSLCMLSLNFIIDEGKAAKVMMMHDTAESFVSTLLALSFLVLLSRLLFWPLTLPLRAALFMNPVRLVQRHKPEKKQSN